MFNIGKNNSQQEMKEQKQESQSKSTNYSPPVQSTSYGSNRAKNVIAEGTEIEGTVNSKGDIQIDGRLVGTITSEGKLTVSKTGFIDGDVFCKDAEFDGEISGNVKARGKVVVKPKAHIKGDVRYYDLQVEPGAHIACTVSRLNPDAEKKNTFTKESKSFSGSKSSAKATVDSKETLKKPAKNVLPLEEELKGSKNGVS